MKSAKPTIETITNDINYGYSIKGHNWKFDDDANYDHSSEVEHTY